MSLGKQAKILSNQQIKLVLRHFDDGRNATRNKLIFLLSVAAGLRAKEIADLEVSMITDSEGNVSDVLALQDKASKGSSGRTIPMKGLLQDTIKVYLAERKNEKFANSPYLIITERSNKFSSNAVAVFFKRLYDRLGFVGSSSHSGRRTFITNCARKLSLVGGSLKDLKLLSGHKNTSVLASYIEVDTEAQRKLVEMIYSI